jgi:hypothetical protein
MRDLIVTHEPGKDSEAVKEVFAWFKELKKLEERQKKEKNEAR